MPDLDVQSAPALMGLLNAIHIPPLTQENRSNIPTHWLLVGYEGVTKPRVQHTAHIWPLWRMQMQ